MQRIVSRESLQRFYGRSIHLYEQGIECHDWLIVPFGFGRSFTTSCFCRKGKRYISWSQHSCLEDAIAAGRLFVLRRVKEMASTHQSTMTQNKPDSPALNRIPKGGIHLYTLGVLSEGWWIVPVDWGGESYTVSCFDPRGTNYPKWQHYPNPEKAIAAGKIFVASQMIDA